jgi:hypothetical protein
MKRLVLVLTVAICIGAVAPLAFAKPANVYKTTSTLEVKEKTIAGKLSSSKGACFKNRRVIGEWSAPGTELFTEPANSDASGRWVIQFEVAPGSKGRLSINGKPKRLSDSILCKGFETEIAVAKK